MLCCLFLGPWRVGKAAGAASVVLQGNRRLPDHLTMLPDLTPEVSVATPPPHSLRGGEQGHGAHRLWSCICSHSPVFCPPRLFTTADVKTADVCSCRWPWGVFPFIVFYPSSSEECALFIQQSTAHMFIFHLCGLSRRWNKCAVSVGEAQWLCRNLRLLNSQDRTPVLVTQMLWAQTPFSFFAALTTRRMVNFRILIQ